MMVLLEKRFLYRANFSSIVENSLFRCREFPLHFLAFKTPLKSDICVQTLRVQSSASEQEEVQVEVTRLLVECYFDIVRKNLQDAVPKAIMHFLVLFVQRGLQQRLIRTLYRQAHAYTISCILFQRWVYPALTVVHCI